MEGVANAQGEKGAQKHKTQITHTNKKKRSQAQAPHTHTKKEEGLVPLSCHVMSL